MWTDNKGNKFKYCNICKTLTARWIGYGSEYLPALKLVYFSKTFSCSQCDTTFHEQHITGIQ